MGFVLQMKKFRIAKSNKIFILYLLTRLGLNYGLLRSDEKRNESILINTNKLGCSVILDCVGASEFQNVIIYLKSFFRIQV